MKTSGIIRRIDDLGRVVIPVEMRRVLDMGEREALSISLENNAIVLRRAHAGCVFCGSGKDVVDFRGKLVCPRCARQLATVWGDRIFEKCGIRRDEEGDGGKTLEIRGKRRLSARDGGANYQQS